MIITKMKYLIMITLMKMIARLLFLVKKIITRINIHINIKNNLNI